MHAGEIWLVDLEDGKGHEQQGTRPGVIVALANSMAIVIPMTTNIRTTRFSHTHAISPTRQNGLSDTSVAMVFQISTLDQVRLRHKLGLIDDEDWQAIRVLLVDLLKLE